MPAILISEQVRRLLEQAKEPLTTAEIETKLNIRRGQLAAVIGHLHRAGVLARIPNKETRWRNVGTWAYYLIRE